MAVGESVTEQTAYITIQGGTEKERKECVGGWEGDRMREEKK